MSSLGPRSTDSDLPASSDAAMFETWASDEGGNVTEGRPPAARLGRYLLRGGIGAGGMGEVYRAYDPKLDREVAIKRLALGEHSPDAQQRLLREGQTIARLSHVHVVQVYDVGTEPSTGDAFIAMELIEGSTLRAWLQHERRPWRAIAEVFAQAGEGLAAAHARGSVHRDFKPENVLVTREGIAKVVDFGLAKPVLTPNVGANRRPHEHDTVDLDPQPTRDTASVLQTGINASALALHSALTRAGARLGTPAYMAPEQHLGETSDPRSDQFAFAVALYEALVGRLPFAGSTPTEYTIAVLDGAVRPFAGDAPVPRHLQRTVMRALRVNPNDRFDDLGPLIQELRRDPAKQRRRIAATLGAGLLGATGMFGVGEFLRDDDEATKACASVADAAKDLWPGERRRALVEAIASLPSALAEDTSTRVAAMIDAWSEAWTDRRTDACLTERSSPRGRLTEARRLCFDRNLARQRKLIAALRDATPLMLEHAIDALERVDGDLDRCAVPAYLEQIVAEESMPDDLRQQVISDLIEARHLFDLGQVDAASVVLESMATQMDATTWPAAVILEWSELQGRIAGKRGDLREFRDRLEAGLLGLGGTAPLAAAQWHLAHGDVLYELDELDRAARAYARAHTIFEQRNGPDAIETILAAATRGHVPFARGQYQEALALYREAAQAASVVAAPTDSRRMSIDEWVAETLAAAGHHAEAAASMRSLIERHERTRGAMHPMVVETRVQLGIIALRSGEAAQAVEILEHALALHEHTFATSGALERATILANIGAARSELGDHQAATEALEAALESFLTGGFEPEHTRTLAIRANLAESLSRQGRHGEAAKRLREILAAMREAGIDDTRNGLMVQLNLGTALLDDGRCTEAISVLERAVTGEGAQQHEDIVERLSQRLVNARAAQCVRTTANER